MERAMEPPPILRGHRSGVRAVRLCRSDARRLPPAVSDAGSAPMAALMDHPGKYQSLPRQLVSLDQQLNHRLCAGLDHWGRPCCRRRSGQGGELVCAGVFLLPAVLEPKAVHVHLQNLKMVVEPVQQGAGQDLISEALGRTVRLCT